MREETGLIFDEHYTFTPWRTLKPYRQVQGSAPNHALTEYYLYISQIDLTLEGYLYLQQKIQSDERLVWFSIEDMVRGNTVDGKIPFINALYDDFSGDREALRTELINLSDSFSSGYRFQPKKYGVTLPIDCQNPVQAGVLGKDKPLERGVAIFAKACFGHPSPSKRQKLNATANAFGAPIRPRHLVPT
ncbi:hypothetical protein BHECKSOX_1145, partial [Bathymodiolus heckerae thiotrophic gill symbiont]